LVHSELLQPEVELDEFDYRAMFEAEISPEDEELVETETDEP